MRKAGFLSAIIFGIVFISGSLFAQDVRIIEEKLIAVGSGGDLTVEADAGSIILTAWDRDEVSVKISGNENAVENYSFSIEKTSNGVDVRCKRKGAWRIGSWLRNVKINFEIFVPSKFNTDISTAGGDISLSKVNGIQECKTSGGDLKFMDMSGKINGSTSGGDIVVKGFMGPVKLRTSGGDISTEEFTGAIEARTSGGDIDLKVNDGAVRASTSGGDVRLIYSGENEGINLSTSGGDIEVFVSSEIKADVYLSTSGGRAKVKLENSKAEVAKSSKYEGTINGGGPELIAKSSGGDVIVSNK